MSKRFLLYFWGFVLMVFSSMEMMAFAGFRVNTSASVPVGLYRITSAPLSVGSYVLLCPEEREPFITAKKRGYIDAGYCPGGLGYMFKRVAGMQNDKISMDATGMHIDGHLYPDSKPLKHDGLNRPLPVWRAKERSLKKDELILMTQGDTMSFDSRYFGPVARQQIVSVVKPVLTWR